MKNILIAAFAAFVLMTGSAFAQARAVGMVIPVNTSNMRLTMAQAQTPPIVVSPIPATTMLAWDASPAGENILGYRVYLTDNSQNVLLITTMSDTTQVPFPALTPGIHTLVVRAYNEAGESLDSNVLTVKVVVVPAPVTGLRIQ